MSVVICTIAVLWKNGPAPIVVSVMRVVIVTESPREVRAAN